MKIDFVLPASPIPGDIPPAPVDTDANVDSALFSVALEAETLKALTLVAPESKSDTVIATGVVQFLTPDSDNPTQNSDLELKISEVLEKAAALPSLAGLIWNDTRWQNLPTPEVPTPSSPTEQGLVSGESPAPAAPEADLAPIVETAAPVANAPLPAPFLEETASFVDQTQAVKSPEKTKSADEPKFPSADAQPEPASKFETVASLPKAAEKTASIEPRIETPKTAQTTPQGFEHQVKVDQPKQAEPRQTDRVQNSEPVEDTPVKQSAPEIRHPQHPKDSPQTTEAPIEQVLAAEVVPVQLQATATDVSAKEGSAEPRRIEPIPENSIVAEASANEPVTPPTQMSPQQNQNENRGDRKPDSADFEVHVQARTREAEPPLKTATEAEGETRPNTKVIGARDAAHPASIAVPRDIKHHSIDSPAALETPESTQAAQWTQIEKSNVLNQLIEKARSLRWDRNSEIIVSLKPESLGRISMRASLVDRTMVATIAAESDKVRQILQLDLPVIQRSLQENGIVARVEVSHQSDLNLSQGNPNPSHGQPRFRQNDSLPFQEEVISHTPAATTEVADARYSTHSVHLIA